MRYIARRLWGRAQTSPSHEITQNPWDVSIELCSKSVGIVSEEDSTSEYVSTTSEDALKMSKKVSID